MDEHENLINQFHSLRAQVADTQEQLDADPDNVDLQTQLADQTQLYDDNLVLLQDYTPP